MNPIKAVFNLKLTALVKPADYQECLVYSPCEGFMIATWKTLGGESGFYLFATYEPMHADQTLLWVELPTVDEMTRLCLSIADPVLEVKQVASQLRA
ncbi:hypothetical protein WBQ28_05710 [Pseudomonas syringae pv. syringae]|uniref:hypothetical protein n=1 Tax=Pseudomonas syringae group TaxID=136849 RepID=UPI0005A4D02C|nr:hypothetical protein [Pseudomonas coronafaciens]KGS15038.1 hypothetical protein OA77_07870 [Pseudomonas coronafaciens]